MNFSRVFQGLDAVAMAFALAGLAAAASSAGKSQSASKIIDSYLRAEGGAKRLSQLRTVEFQGTVTDRETKATGTYTLILERPNRLYEEENLGGETTREAYNGSSAWRQDASGLRTLTGDEGALLEATAHYRNDRFVHYKSEKERVRLAGEETVGGRAAERVEVITSANVRRQVYFDEASHLIVKEVLPEPSPEREGTSGETRITYQDYRSVDGVLEPYEIDYETGGHAWNVNLTRVSQNPVEIDAVFAFPAVSKRPLPAIADLLNAVDRNQKTVEKLVEKYTCDKVEEEFQVDSKGALKSKGVKKYNVFYLDGDEVDRLVQKDGKDCLPRTSRKRTSTFKK